MIKVILHENKKNRTDAIKSKLQGYKFLKLVDNAKDLFDSIDMLIENLHKDDNKTIIMHNSDFDSEPLNKIIRLCEKNNIDLVFFTGGDTAKKLRENETPKANLTAEHLYTGDDFFYFLNKFDDDYNLGYLVFGKDFELNNFLDLRMFINLELNRGNDDPADIYDSLKEKRIDIDSLTEKLELISGKSNFNNKMINSIKTSLDSKISKLILDGDSKIEKPLLVHNDNTFLVDHELFKDRNKKFDFSIDDFISDVLLNKDFDCLVIPFSLSENYLEFTGLELAYHVRLTQELGDLRFVPIVFFGAETPYSISKLNNRLSPILYTEGVFITEEEVVVAYLSKELIGTTSKKIKDQIVVLPPSNYSSHHSVANEWSILRWAKYLGIDKRDDFRPLSEKIDSLLYYKYLLNKYPISQIKKGEIEIEGNGKVLLIDDEYKKGWKLIFEEIFKGDNFEFEALEADFEKPKSDIVEIALKKIDKDEFDPDIVILDFRLHNSEFYNTEAKDFISIDILRKIKALNKGIQVIIFTASNKVWNLQELKRLGSDEFIIKESPEFNQDNEFSERNFTFSKKILKKAISRKYLKIIWENIQNIKSKLNKAPLSFITKDESVKFIEEVEHWLDNGFDIIAKDDSQKLKNSAFVYFYHVFEAINKYRQEESSNISNFIQKLSDDKNDVFGSIKRKRKKFIHGGNEDNINIIAKDLMEIIEFIKKLFDEASKDT